MQLFEPFKHQIEAQRLLRDMEKDGGKGGFLADKAGLGKTATMSMFLKANKLPGLPDLIVCPVSVLRTWEREILLVNGHDPKPNILIYHGAGRQGELKRKKWDYVVTTYAILGAEEFGRKSWGRVVLDESHYIKNGLLKKPPRCAKGAYVIAKHSQFRFCISATPFNNRMKDIAAQAKFVGTLPYANADWWLKGSNDTSEWRKKYVIRRTKEGMLSPIKYTSITLEPTKQESQLVDALRSKAASDFNEWRHAKGVRKIQLQAKLLGLIQRLRIVSDSFYSGDDPTEPDQIMEDCAKVDRLVEDLDGYVSADPRKGVVVFSQFTSFLDILEQCIDTVLPHVEILKFTGSTSEPARNAVVKYFNTSVHPRIILVSLMAGGVGLSLHHGSSTAVLAENYYNPFAEEQAEERVHRLGQVHQVHVYRYTMKNSVETWIEGLKQRKLALANSLDLVSTDIIPQDLSFDDIAELFSDHVMFSDGQKPDIDLVQQEKQAQKKSKTGRKAKIPKVPKLKRILKR